MNVAYDLKAWPLLLDIHCLANNFCNSVIYSGEYSIRALVTAIMDFFMVFRSQVRVEKPVFGEMLKLLGLSGYKYENLFC